MMRSLTYVFARLKGSGRKTSGKRWLALALALGAAAAYRYRRRDLASLLENMHLYSAPNAALYDAVTAPVLDGFFTRIAGDMAELAPRGHVLEIGSGPGRLGVKLARAAPDIQVTGIDISPEMVDRANLLATRSGIAD